jgi:hypothetical protein
VRLSSMGSAVGGSMLLWRVRPATSKLPRPPRRATRASRGHNTRGCARLIASPGSEYREQRHVQGAGVPHDV